MPFFDDTGIREEIDRGPFWQAFATFGGQLERMIVLNIGWALALAPAVAAMLLINAPDALRLLLIVLTAAAIPPATLVMYAMLRGTTEGEPLDFYQTRDLLRRYLFPSYRTFAPLLGFLGFLAWLVIRADAAGVFAASVLLQLVALVVLVSANYWGALLVDHPDWSAPTVLVRALKYIWRAPGQTLLVSVAVLLALILGAISVGGLVLAVPVIVALLQTNMYLALLKRKRPQREAKA